MTIFEEFIEKSPFANNEVLAKFVLVIFFKNGQIFGHLSENNCPKTECHTSLIS